MGIALSPDREVNQRMARKLLEHVGEEPDARLHVVAPRPVELDGDADPRFGCLARNFRLAHGFKPSRCAALLAALQHKNHLRAALRERSAPAEPLSQPRIWPNEAQRDRGS